MIFSSAIDNCFRAPRSQGPPGPARPVLYVLRRDLEQLYGSEKRAHIKNYKAPMLAILGMMAGIDLMAKLHFGKTSNLGGEKFKEFLQNYGKLSKDEAEALYRYRCALAHNYGLFSIDKKGKQYKFSLNDSPSNRKLIRKIRNNRYHINFWQMKKFFLYCIGELESRLRDPNYPNHNTLLNNFMSVVKEIGYLKVT
ncbi:MAG: hypothetical protein ACETWM_08920 [Candidatus Lokiarchaeia archaeon]